MSKIRKICTNGHSFYKNSECNSCPICAQSQKPQDNFLSLLSAPARRALQQYNINTLQILSTYPESEILALHGMGKSGIAMLKKLLAAEQLNFKPVAPKE